MASGPYFKNLEKALKNYYESGTWYAMLLSGYTEDRDTHDFMNDIVGSQVAAGNGYTSGGKVATAPTVAFNATTNLFTIAFPQVVWSSATISATHCVWYKELGTDAQDEPAYVNDFGATVTSTNADFTVPACNFTIDFP